jgi:hypothetical protein
MNHIIDILLLQLDLEEKVKFSNTLIYINFMLSDYFITFLPQKIDYILFLMIYETFVRTPIFKKKYEYFKGLNFF